MLGFWVFVVLLLGPASLGLGAQRILPGEPLYPALEVHLDYTKSQSFNELRSGQFFAKGSPIVGFKDVNFWVRMDIENAGTDRQRIVLEEQWALTDHIHIYQVRPDGSLTQFVRGHKEASYPGQRLHRFPYAEMLLEPGVHTIYIRYETLDIVGSRVALWHADDFRLYQLVSQLIYGFLLGCIFVMSAYNFFLYLAIRTSAYFYYAFYSFAFFLFQACFSGFLSQLSGQYQWWTDEGTTAFSSMAIVGVVLFTQRFLQLKTISIGLYHAGWLPIGFACAALAMTFVAFQQAALGIIAGNITVASWIIVCALRATYKKVPEGMIYLLAWGFFVLGDLGTILYYMGFVGANLITQWGMVVGSVTEVVMLSFGLANYVHRMRQEMHETREQLNRELAQSLTRVEAQVQSRTRDIRLILQNIQQGIFTIQGEKLLIQEEHSAALLPLLGETQVSGRSFDDVFLRKLDLDADQRSQIQSALMSMQAEDVVSFELNSHVLPRETQLQRATGDKRTLELNWEPMLDEKAQVERVLVTLRDVTMDRELEAKSRDQSEEIMIISSIVQGDPRLFGMFLKSSHASLLRAFELVRSGKVDAETQRELHRILHTVKGNARSEKMQNLARIIHECEEKIQQSTMNVDDLTRIETELRRYHKTFENYFATHFNLDAVNIPRDDLLDLHEFLRKQGFEKQAFFVRGWLQKSLFSLSQIQSRLEAEIPALATELGKEPCVLHCIFENAHVNHEVFEALIDICGHLLRNSMDHGLESTAERIKAGKTAYGHIHINFVNGDDPYIIWRDDGLGLDIRGILGKARTLSLVHDINDARLDEEFCQKILTTSGFTTRNSASLVSGRGVGLDAVQHRLQAIGGRLQLRFIGEPNSQKRQSFEFILWLPGWVLRASESPIKLPNAS